MLILRFHAFPRRSPLGPFQTVTDEIKRNSFFFFSFSPYHGTFYLFSGRPLSSLRPGYQEMNSRREPYSSRKIEWKYLTCRGGKGERLRTKENSLNCFSGNVSAGEFLRGRTMLRIKLRRVLSLYVPANYAELRLENKGNTRQIVRKKKKKLGKTSPWELIFIEYTRYIQQVLYQQQYIVRDTWTKRAKLWTFVNYRKLCNSIVFLFVSVIERN